MFLLLTLAPLRCTRAAPPVPVDDASEVGSVVSGAASTVLHKLVPSAGNVRRQMTLMWENVIGALRQLVDVLRANFVPPLVVRELLGQLLQFIDFKLFNASRHPSPRLKRSGGTPALALHVEEPPQPRVLPLPTLLSSPHPLCATVPRVFTQVTHGVPVPLCASYFCVAAS